MKLGVLVALGFVHVMLKNVVADGACQANIKVAGFIDIGGQAIDSDVLLVRDGAKGGPKSVF